MTSTVEGVDLGLIKVWQELAASECRLELMTKLKNLNLGLAEVEEFNLGINVQFRSEKSREKLANGENKFVKAAMESKSMDEVYKNSEITRERNKKRRELAEQYGKNTRRYNGIIKKLRTEARLVKTEYKEKYKNKLEHLLRKYREDEDSRMDKVPENLQEFSNLSVFDKNKFSKVTAVTYDARVVGEVEVDEDEKAILRMNPKFSINQNLQEGGFEFEQEQAYAKARMEIGKELEERVEDPVEMTEEEEETAEQLEAKTLQTFDPETRTYDDQNRRVTDLQECARVTLPRPLPTKHEAFIEIRRDVHAKIYNQYRQEFCNKNGEQKSNLTEQEQRGLKKLQKRIQEDNLIIIKTNKSGKFCNHKPRELH